MIPIAIGIVLRIIPIIIGSGGRKLSASLPAGRQGNRQLLVAANRQAVKKLTFEVQKVKIGFLGCFKN